MYKQKHELTEISLTQFWTRGGIYLILVVCVCET